MPSMVVCTAARATPPSPIAMHRPSPAKPGQRACQRGHPFDDRKALPLSDIDRADGARRQVDRACRRDADTQDVASRGRQCLGDE